MLDINLYETKHRIDLLSNVITAIISSSDDSGNIKLQFPEGITNEDFDNLKSVLIMNFQMDFFLHQLIGHMSIFENQICLENAKLRGMLKSIHHIVKYKAAIPTEIVFVSFIFDLKIMTRLHYVC